MISKGLVELTKCRLREFAREPSAMIFVVLMPIIWMVVVGFAFTKDREEKIALGLVKQSAPVSSEYRSVESLLENNSTFQVSKDSYESLKEQLKLNKISLIVLWQNKKLIYHYDKANPDSYKSRLLVDNYLQKQSGRQDTLQTQDSIYTPPGSRYIDFLIPGLIALSLMTTSLFGTGMVIVVSRREKLLQRLLVTPMKKIDYFLSHIFSRYMIVVLEVGVVLTVGFFLFGFSIKGSFLEFLLFCLLGASCFTSLAVLIAARGKNSSAYSGLVNLIFVFLMFLSGVWFSRTGFPSWLQTLGDISPLSALVDALRKLALEGVGGTSLIREGSLLLAYTLAFLALSKRLFSWR